MSDITVAFARALLRLSGMSHAQGKYTPEEWQEKTGANPRDYPAYVRIDDKGRCHWTHNAEQIANAYHGQTQANGAAMGLRHR